MLHSPRPAWRTKIVAAKAAAFLMMTPAEIQERESERLARRAQKIALKAQRRERTKLTGRMLDDGATLVEISAAVGWSPRRIREVAAERGMNCASADRVRRAINITIAREHALRRLAEDLGVIPRRALQTLVGFALDDDAAIARRLLHVRRGSP